MEQRLFSGELLGVTATSALELGIDVGSLDAAIVTTFPGTIASFRQQAGRAGRTREESLAVLVAGEDALDQYYAHHPGELFRRPSEKAVVNPANPQVLAAHAGCAAFEKPLAPEDREFLGEEIEELAPDLVASGDLRPRGGLLYWDRREAPAPGIDIRTAGGPPLDHRGRAGRGGGHGGRGAGLQPDPPRGGVPAPGRRLPGGVPRPGRAPGAGAPRGGALVHPAPRGDLGDGAPGGGGGPGGPLRPLPRRGRGGEPRARLQAPRPGRPHRPGLRAARPAAPPLHHPGAVGDPGRRPARRRRHRDQGPARHPARRRAHLDRHAPPVRHLRPLGRRRPLHPLPPRHRRAGVVHLRRLPRRGGHRPHRLGRRGAPPAGHPRGAAHLPLRLRLPLVRAVAQVRQLQRASRQAGGHRPAGGRAAAAR